MIFAVIPILLPPLLMIIPDATWVAVITLLILQTSFILPPFGYAVMMIGHRLNNRVGTRALATALMPYVVVQLVVLTLVIGAPALLWRSPGLADASAATGANLSDAQVRELLDEQLRLQQEDAAPVAPR